MSKPKKIPYRNRNHTGWWIASYLIRFEWYDEDRANPNRRATAWEDTVLIKASSREIAYKKTIGIGKSHNGSEAWDSSDHQRKGAWRFEGLTSLLPIYDKIEDGVEILWREYESKSVKGIRAMVKRKADLECFDDAPGPAELFQMEAEREQKQKAAEKRRAKGANRPRVS
jgi:hypothetical protein